MKEIKSPQKNWMYYGIIVMLIMTVLNLFIFPNLMTPQVEEVPYSTFIAMLEKGEVSEVSKDEVQITFSDTSTQPRLFRTGLMDDPGAGGSAEQGRGQVYHAHCPAHLPSGEPAGHLGFAP